MAVDQAIDSGDWVVLATELVVTEAQQVTDPISVDREHIQAEVMGARVDMGGQEVMVLTTAVTEDLEGMDPISEVH